MTYDANISAIMDMYWARVGSNALFYGRDEVERASQQERLRSATVGISGVVGVGSLTALRLAQAGVGNLRIFDDGLVSISSLGSQVGGGLDMIGEPLADSVAKEVQRFAPEASILSFSGDLDKETADAFVEECDLIIEHTPFFTLDNKVQMHKSFREGKSDARMITCYPFGWTVLLCEYKKDGVRLEDWIGESGGKVYSDLVERIMHKMHNNSDSMPSVEKIANWSMDNGTLPVFSPSIPVSVGLLVSHTIVILLGLEERGGFAKMPQFPEVFRLDIAGLEGRIVSVA